MEKIQLLNNSGWFYLGEHADEFHFDDDPKREPEFKGMVIYKTKKGNFVTKYWFNKDWYRKSKQEEIDLYNNRYTFPPEEEQ